MTRDTPRGRHAIVLALVLGVPLASGQGAQVGLGHESALDADVGSANGTSTLDTSMDADITTDTSLGAEADAAGGLAVGLALDAATLGLDAPSTEAEARLVGAFAPHDDHHIGTHVRFAIERDLLDRPRAVVDVETNRGPLRLFDRITLDGMTHDEAGANGTHRVHGAGQLVVHDVANALISFETEGDHRVRFAIPANGTFQVTWKAAAGEGGTLDLASGARVLVEADTLRHDRANGTIVANGTGHVRLQVETLYLGPEADDGDPADEPAPRQGVALSVALRQRLNEAAWRHEIGAEAWLGTDGPGFDIATGTTVVTHAAAATDTGPWTVTVEGPHGSDGTVLAIRLDPAAVRSALDASADARLHVAFDGRDTRAAADLRDALAWDDDGGEAEHFVLWGHERVDVLVTVPHFSTHRIDVTGGPEPPRPSGGATGADTTSASDAPHRSDDARGGEDGTTGATPTAGRDTPGLAPHLVALVVLGLAAWRRR